MKTPSPNLEIISSNGRVIRQSGERRRLPRLNLSTEQFRLSKNGKLYPVVDLSFAGMAVRLLDPGDYVHFSVGASVGGLINIRGEKHFLEAQVRHLGTDVVGCEFMGLSQKLKGLLEEFLSPVHLGRELRPMPISTDESSLWSLWYHGPSGTDLFFSRGVDGQYRQFVFVVLGTYVQWDITRGLVTGRVIDSDGGKVEFRGIARLDPTFLDPDASLDAAKLSIAKTLVLSSNLPQDLKKWCIRRLESPEER